MLKVSMTQCNKLVEKSSKSGKTSFEDTNPDERSFFAILLFDLIDSEEIPILTCLNL